MKKSIVLIVALAKGVKMKKYVLSFLIIVSMFLGLAYAAEDDMFSLYQTIPTHGASDWESFTINGEPYLALSNIHDGDSADIDSKIYKWDGSSFVEIQSILTHGAYDWESFIIDGETYLAVSNYQDNSGNYNIYSKIYKWDGSSFVEIQSILTHGATQMESFTINGETYLAVANYFDGSIYTLDSEIYKWNGSSFVEIQSIPTSGARAWESFIIDGETYLAVANAQNVSMSFNIDSKIYKWNGSSFVEIQSIPTSGAVDWESFIIDGETYLAVANNYNGSNYDNYSKIYRWDGSSFVEIQSIFTHAGVDWESFIIDGGTYLAVANMVDDTQNTDSWIYKSNCPNSPPSADAGPDQIICNEFCDSVILDGRGSKGSIVTHTWALNHRENSSFDTTASGVTPSVTGLEPGNYDVILTVTSNDGSTNTDTMVLNVQATCDPCALLKGDLDSDGDVDGNDLRIFSGFFGTLLLHQ